MFIYMSKKIAIPKQGQVTCLSWNQTAGFIAVGGEDGMLKVLKLEPGSAGNLSTNLSLEGHSGQLRIAIWNETYQKLTTSDERGVIIVWMLYKGSWYEEMINNRNKSTVTGMAWGSDGQKICIAYEDGAVIVGSVDGSRVWGKDIKGPGLSAVQWSPDNSLLLFALLNGDLHLYDDQGNYMMPVTIKGLSTESEVVSLDWYSGKASPNRPTLAICYNNGIIVLMKHCTDEESIIIKTNVKIVMGCWNHNGTVLAVAAINAEEANLVQLYDAYGQDLRTLKVPGGSMRAITWERQSLRLAVAVDSYIYFANVKPDHKYTYFGNTLAYVSSADSVTFWDTLTHQSWINHISEVVDMAGVGEYCVLATQNTLVVCNQQGIQCDAKNVTTPILYVCMNSKAIVVAASKTSFLVWKFFTPVNYRSFEQIYHSNGTSVTSDHPGYQDETICCISCSNTYLLVGKESGIILLFSLANYKKITSINLNSKPYKMGLNSNSSKLYVIDQSGSIYLLDTDMANNVSVGQALRKDVWAALWAADNPQMLAVAEKARLYVLRNTEPEEPLTMQGYLCTFKDLEITMALLDNITDKCKVQHIVQAEVKSLRDTKQLIEKVGLKEAEDFINDNPHPKLWLLLAEAALKDFESESALEMAEAAFVRRSDFTGIKFVSRLKVLHSNALKKAEILVYFRDFDAAEKIYLKEDRRDLAIALRKRLGHWFRVVELLKMSSSTTEAQMKQAYSNIGDYYLDRQNWNGAIDYYTMCNNVEGLKKCYMALEDNESLSKLLDNVPGNQSKTQIRKNVVMVEAGDSIWQTNNIQNIIYLKECGKISQSASMAFKLAGTEASRKASPLRIKMLYVLAALLHSQHSAGDDGDARREMSRCYRAAAAQHWLGMAAERARRPPPRTAAALCHAAQLRLSVDDLHPAQHLQAWCIIAVIAIECRAFDLCSQAFIKLESLNAQHFQDLAIEIFSRYKPRDLKTNKLECPSCSFSCPDWYGRCPGCGFTWDVCAVSGRALSGAGASAGCAACGALAAPQDLVLRRSCPMCHAHIP